MTSGSISRIGAVLERLGFRAPGHAPHDDHSMRRKLLIGTGVALVFTLILAASVIGRSLDDYRRASRNLRGLESYRLILTAANLLSAERGPSNSILGDNGTSYTVLRERLSQFRARSAAILERLTVTGVVPAELIMPARAQLFAGRREVDRVAAIPHASRSLEDVQSAIEKMVDVIDKFQPVVAWKAGKLIESNPDLAEPVMTGRIFSELREYGGRIGSHIAAPIAVGEPMPLKNIIDGNRTRGRILELWDMIGDQAVATRGDPRLTGPMRDAERMFLGDGLGLIDRMTAEGRGSGQYTLTADQFTLRFVETLKPLERLRGAFLDVAIERLTETRNNALTILVMTVVMMIAVFGVLASLVVTAQRFVFGPLMRARDAVIALAEDRPVVVPAGRTHATEMRRLFDAISILRDSLAERASLTSLLKVQAETDSLTGLMNRRALDMIGESHSSSEVTADGVCLVLMDIDHFKSINDGHGHLEGDRVLQESVKVICPILGVDDLFARFGGEEFVIVSPGRGLGETMELAERIRRALETNGITLSDGTVLSVTASFGVASGNLGQPAWRELIEAADAALYRAKSEGRNCVRCSQPAPSLVPDLPGGPGIKPPAQKAITTGT